MTAYLAKYRPLACTPEGQLAVARFQIPPFVDGSCRREPDLEAGFPSISALCRGALFAPHLSVGDEVIFITSKDFYERGFKHWRIVARVRVDKRFESHSEAARWYRENGGALPSNCMVQGNPPKPLNQTLQGDLACGAGCGGAKRSLQEWDEHYQARADAHPIFFACQLVWKFLDHPQILTQTDAIAILGTWARVNARAPIIISKAEMRRLELIALMP